ncbi:acyl carrier protein phosphodiesterase [Halomonas sp. WWR20]
MNFLAHAWLARNGSDDFLYGNLIADGVKGTDLDAWPVEVAQGIRHHRHVDATVDHHPLISAAKARAPSAQRRFVGIALDLVWDHFVALHHHDPALVRRCYRLMSARPAPNRLATMVPSLVAGDWLSRYADFGFTCRAIEGLGRRLSRADNPLAQLVPWLEADYVSLEQDFWLLWPALQRSLSVPVR